MKKQLYKLWAIASPEELINMEDELDTAREIISADPELSEAFFAVGFEGINCVYVIMRLTWFQAFRVWLGMVYDKVFNKNAHQYGIKKFKV